MKVFSALLALCVGNSPVTGEFPSQRPVTRSFDMFFDLRLNNRLSKQSWGWWFETPARSLWRNCNVTRNLGENMSNLLVSTVRADGLAQLRVGKSIGGYVRANTLASGQNGCLPFGFLKEIPAGCFKFHWSLVWRVPQKVSSSWGNGFALNSRQHGHVTTRTNDGPIPQTTDNVSCCLLPRALQWILPGGEFQAPRSLPRQKISVFTSTLESIEMFWTCFHLIKVIINTAIYIFNRSDICPLALVVEWGNGDFWAFLSLGAWEEMELVLLEFIEAFSKAFYRKKKQKQYFDEHFNKH